VKAVADNIEESLRKTGIRPSHMEGYEQSGWILLDYFDFIVHVFTAEQRVFYSLERLWGNARRIDLPDKAA
jgi:ribosome-associated protein